MTPSNYPTNRKKDFQLLFQLPFQLPYQLYQPPFQRGVFQPPTPPSSWKRPRARILPGFRPALRWRSA
jgi:hypothetical protein